MGFTAGADILGEALAGDAVATGVGSIAGDALGAGVIGAGVGDALGTTLAGDAVAGAGGVAGGALAGDAGAAAGGALGLGSDGLGGSIGTGVAADASEGAITGDLGVTGGTGLIDGAAGLGAAGAGLTGTAGGAVAPALGDANAIGANAAFSPVDEPLGGGFSGAPVVSSADDAGNLFDQSGTPYGPPSDATAPYNAEPDQTIAPAAGAPGTSQSTVDKALGAATKYGPLALSGAGLFQGQSAAKAAGKQIASVGQPQRDAASALLTQYNSGKLNAGDAASVQQFTTDALAKSRQYFAQAGLSNSSQAAAAEAQIQAQAAAMQSQMLQGYLTSAMNELNITDANQVAGITAELQGDQQATASAANFLNAYGSWLRGTQQPAAK